MEKKDFKILVVDDDDMVREFVSSVLIKQGYSVISARDGFDGLRMLLMVEDIKLVITDLKMPGASGMDILEYTQKNNPDIAVVILTGFGTIEDALEAVTKGAFDYLTKPFKVEEIVFVAEKAFKREIIVCENRELKRILRDTYRDIGTVRDIINSNDAGVVSRWMDRMNRLKAMNVLTESEIKVLREKIVKTNA
ncbi:Transcriptional regulatory protein GlrR [bacterium HR37]|jgi:DNA-binding NtrC family response regulator|nr:Transcriptional regulatory protein GlrR [bacterium HR37]